MAYIQKEHIRQRMLCDWVRDAVDVQHVFQSFDSAKKSSPQAWQREKSRGVLPGCADTLLCIVGAPPIWCEFKAPGGKPTEAQVNFGIRMMEMGHHWFWADSVHRYWQELHLRLGVSLRPNAELLAQHYDAKADSMIARAEMRGGVAPRPRKAVPRFVAGKRLSRVFGGAL